MAAGTDTRNARERAFHDARYQDDQRARLQKYYCGALAGPDRYQAALRDAVACRGRARVLEYGCGTGSAAFDLARAGCEVVGIDISQVAIEVAETVAQAEGLVDARFSVMDAHALTFDDNAFDLVCGSGILHHLELERALPELARVLRPGGRAVFYEPLGHNLVLRAYRRLTPRLRTPDEHPLLVGDLRLAGRSFASVESEHCNLTALLAAPLAARPIGARLARPLHRLDRALFRSVPALRRYSWTAVLTLQQPV
jgi:SAM-dependent methyltransferase